MSTTEAIGTFICKNIDGDQCVDPTDHFAVDAPVVHMMYKTADLPKAGDVYVIQWIAEDVGQAAPPNTVIGTVNEPVTDLGFGVKSYQVDSKLTKPTSGWPVGKYRVEVKLDGTLVTTAHFKVE
ncbi:MAG TPA: hypothetical protein VGG28_34275 [Kofleriaceae bacterium]|jgi:hypothetical protein